MSPRTAPLTSASTGGATDYPATLEACHRLIDQLREAVESRDVIGQAKGVLIARQNISDEEAFMILVRASQRENRKLRDVAADVTLRAWPPGSPDRPRR